MTPLSRRAVIGAALAAPAFPAAALSAVRAGQPPFPAPAAAPPASPAPPSAAAPPPPPRLRDEQVEPLLKMLAEAPSHGLDVDPAAGDLKARLRGGDGDAARADVRRLAIAYAAAQHGQRVPLGKFDANWGMKPQPYNALIDFDFATAHDRIPAWIAAQPPPFAHYRTLRDGLATYEGLARDGGWPTTPAGPDLAPGAVSPRVRAMRARLAFEEEGLARKGAAAATFDPALVAAVRRFQARHGIAPTGTVGASTLKAMNASPTDRAQTIRMNLERWRWLPRDRKPDRLEVNIASATLDLYADDARVDTMLAAAGRPADQSPLLVSDIGSIVFNPAWHVPQSIASKELFKKGNGYLKAHGFSYVKDNPGAPLIQKPGPKNALGRIKFDFPNPYSVYLHDTPGQAAFSRTARDVSHGCVRLQHPEELAKRLLASSPDWPADRIDQVLAGVETTRARLPAPMPVMLLYWTAFDEGAQLSFRDDVYGWDAQLAGLLKA